jgi:hypothetical protein
MKKLALIGMVVAGLLLSTSVALAKPTGMTPGEFQALITRSQALNLKYGDYEYAQPSQASSTPLVSEKLAGLGLQPQSNVTSTSDGFGWNDAGIGAALAFAGVLGIGAVLMVRHQHRPIAH